MDCARRPSCRGCARTSKRPRRCSSTENGVIRIGGGAGFAGDRIEPAVDLAERGRLDYLAFECLAERTLAYGHLARMADPARGYDPRIEKRLGAVLKACVANRTVIITNMGVANPIAAGRVTIELARRMGLKLRVAVIEGDEITH